MMSITDESGVDEYRQILPYFLKRYLPLLLVVGGLFATYFTIDITHERHKVEMQEASRVALALHSIESDIAGVTSELRYLAESSALLHYLESGSEADRIVLQREFVTFARQFRRYQQLRLLDLQGMERVRVNVQDGSATGVELSQLQDKSQRYYFREGIAVPPGSVYLSPMDLNVEHGEIEQPYRPMLRFTIQTLDGTGRRNGLLVLNYEAENLLRHFARVDEGGRESLQLLNHTGFWLYHPQRERTFAFMFDRDERFGRDFPREWQEMTRRRRGQLHSENGLFSFTTLGMAAAAAGTSDTMDTAVTGQGGELPRDTLLVVSHYSVGEQDALLHEHLLLYGTFMLLLILFGGVVVWHLARLRWEKEVLLERLELQARVMETATNGVMITDAEQRIVSVNRGFSELTGYSAGEVVGRKPTLLASGRHDEAFYRQMWRDLSMTGHWEGEIWNRHKSGEVYPEWLNISVVRDHNGSISNYIGLFSVLSDQKSTESRLRELANSDPLTGLINRNLLYDRAAQAISLCRRNKCGMAFLFVDLDGFKPINDQLGHAAGDMVLRQVASRLQQIVRESDTVARFGGDEFVLLLQGIAERGMVIELAQKVLDTIGRDIIVAGESCRLGASIGISLYPDDGDSIETLLNAADQAMYRAKSLGRHCYVFAGEA